MEMLHDFRDTTGVCRGGHCDGKRGGRHKHRVGPFLVFGEVHWVARIVWREPVDEVWVFGRAIAWVCVVEDFGSENALIEDEAEVRDALRGRSGGVFEVGVEVISWWFFARGIV